MYPLATEKELGIMYRWTVPRRAAASEPVDLIFHPTSEQLAELKRMFVMYDKNKSGSIDLKELVIATKAAG